MSGDDGFGLDDAYAVETPDDNRRLYAQWASTYDSEFLQTQGYVYDRNVAAAYVAMGGSEPVLDLGCGTGAVGIALMGLGVDIVDGLDISPEMLDKAATKRVGDRAVYRLLMTGDILAGMDLADDVYAGVVSAGTFTHGHVGPEPLAEIHRLLRPGGLLAATVHRDLWETMGFEAALAQLVDARAFERVSLTAEPYFEGGEPEGWFCVYRKCR